MWAIVVAAGSGRRFGGPKQYESLGAGTVLDRSIATAREVVDHVVVVVPPGRALAPVEVEGGATRSESVRRGLAAVPDDAVRTGPRVGVAAGQERPWRLWVAGSPAVTPYKAGRARPDGPDW